MGCFGIACTAARFRDTRLSLCCQPSTSVAEYGWVASPVKAGLRPPPSAADGLDRTCYPTIVCHTPRSRRWRVNALWATGGRGDEPGTLALVGSLLWPGARRARVEDLARHFSLKEEVRCNL